VKLADLKNKLRLPESIGWRDHVIGAALGIAYVVWLLATARSLGFPRDEGFYFRAATQYAQWFRMVLDGAKGAFDRGTIDGAWGYNHEHPALMKTLFSFSWMLFHEKFHVFADASNAFRLPGMAMGGLAIWVTYLFGARHWTRRAGLVAAGLFALMPGVFFHAHLACFDIPITAMWTLSIYVYWRSVEKGGLLWAIAVGVVFGLTLETKHNAWILPFVFFPHAIYAHRRAIVANARALRVSIPLNLVALVVLGPLVFYALWPWMWHDTTARVQEYVAFHLHHEYYNLEYLHVNYFGPPSPKSYMPVLIFATIPTVTIVLFLLGLFDRARAAVIRTRVWISDRVKGRKGFFERLVTALSAPERDKAETDVLFALALGAAVTPWFLSTTPIFGGTKHWMTGYPFLALFAGRGFDLVWSALDRALATVDDRRRLVARIALVAAVFAAPLAVTIHSHPFGIAPYVPFVGGTAGGADLGLNRSFWGYLTENADAWLETHAQRNAPIFIHDTAMDSWFRMLDEKRVRPDLRAVGTPSEAAIALVQHELHMSEVDFQIWMAFGSDAPADVVVHDGVPFVSIYAR
jgi:4-amino-4-deoxy-L-arabinose transferase-like glycosyltransferase